MSSPTVPTLRLTHAAALQMLSAAADEATATGQPQCIVIVDASGEMIASVRMDGAKFLSLRSATAKARTAASINGPSGNIPPDFAPKIAAATGNEVTGLPGGLPIRFGGTLVGGIGVGSGTGDQDLAVGRAGLASVGADEV
ncbi:MAG: heme-binding protein [Pseudomonadota bacterium]